LNSGGCAACWRPPPCYGSCGYFVPPLTILVSQSIGLYTFITPLYLFRGNYYMDCGGGFLKAASRGDGQTAATLKSLVPAELKAKRRLA